MALPRRDALRHTYADYLTWPDGECDELIAGSAYIERRRSRLDTRKFFPPQLLVMTKLSNFGDQRGPRCEHRLGPTSGILSAASEDAQGRP
jgi:hypothetical protein